jgi:hypothetical protein
LPAFVRNLSRGLEEQQTFLRLEWIDPASEHLARERDVIDIGILTAQ